MDKMIAPFLIKQFKTLYDGSTTDIRFFFAPGRVNLIGEHTDYTGGFVMPAGINEGTYCLARKNNTGKIRLSSLNFDSTIYTLDISQKIVKTGKWIDYFIGCIHETASFLNISTGFDALVYGTIPDGAGLSSSASLELAALITLFGMYKQQLPLPGSKEMIKLCQTAQRCENNFVGVNCGIMDQFAIGNAKKNNALFLDCESLEFRYTPFMINPYKLIVANTKKKRRLEESKYNERRSECEKGFELLKKHGLNSSSLGKVTTTEWSIFQDIPGLTDTIQKRLTHVINENERVQKASIALTKGAIIEFAQLLNQSGDSLRNLFEVTGEHLDAMVDILRGSEGVIGARMTGAGFGGCAIALVEENKIEKCVQNITKKYYTSMNLVPEIYQFTISDGPEEWFVN